MNEFKVRCAAIGKTQKELFEELNRHNANMSTVQQFYQYASGNVDTPKSRIVLAAADKILRVWEKEAERNGKTIYKA